MFLLLVKKICYDWYRKCKHIVVINSYSKKTKPHIKFKNKIKNSFLDKLPNNGKRNNDNNNYNKEAWMIKRKKS